MDEISQFNKERWNQLVENKVVCSQPLLNITEDQARSRVEGLEYLQPVQDQSILCLASGGGQQSMAFAKMGGQVTVTDLSGAQLEKDRLAAVSNQLKIKMIQMDMRDFSPFEDASFDIVYQPYSINYVPDVTPVFDGVQRVLKSQGRYYLMFHNPITHGSWTNGSWGAPWMPEELWEGYAYPVRLPYEEGLPVHYRYDQWIFHDQSGQKREVPAPQEFKHTISTIINGLVERGLRILHFEELQLPEKGATFSPGDWDHYRQHAAPWFGIWCQKA
jgi:ubiquinone/menaquinone biosynthesis C-methylase UbiE